MTRLFRIDINKIASKTAVFFLFCTTLCCIPILHYGQNIGISDDEKVRQLVERHKSVNKDKKSTPGYRIQLYFGSNRKEAILLKAGFKGKYPEYEVYLIYQQPNFKVRIGDFKSKFDADRFFKTIKDDYPACFIVPDQIRLPKIDLFSNF